MRHTLEAKKIMTGENTMARFGYVRIYENSSSLESQKDELRKFINEENLIFADTINEKSSPRDGYISLKSLVKQGDELYIKSYYLLGENAKQIKSELTGFRNNGIIIKILDIPSTLIDYSLFNGMQKSVLEIVTNIIADVLEIIEEQEKYSIKKRQKEGIEKSRFEGTLGRPKLEYKSDWDEIYKRWENKEITEEEATMLMKIGRTKFFYFHKIFLENQKQIKL